MCVDNKTKRRQRIAKAVLTQLEQEGCTVAEAQLILQDVRDIILLTAKVTSNWPLTEEQAEISIASTVPAAW